MTSSKQQAARSGLPHALQAMWAIVARELAKFMRQTGRLVSALVRPLLWLAVFAAGFRNLVGVAMSFRPWDGQLRQPLLLTDGVGVIGIAPADGMLHPKNALDTLGADEPEKLCKAR